MPGVQMQSFGTILNSTIIAISAHDFDPCLPAIHASTWSNILWSQPGASRDGNERLEFIGDALMYLCLALELYEHYPAAPPGFMTEIRSPLATNLVFSLLAEKIDGRAAKKGSVLQPVAQLKRHAATMIGKQVRAQIPKNIVKAAADTMEMAIGALYIEKGFSAVREWVATTYEPIIDVAVKAYDRCHNTDFYSVTNDKKRRRQFSGNGDNIQQAKKQKLTPRSVKIRTSQVDMYSALAPRTHASTSRHAGPSDAAHSEQSDIEPAQPDIERIFIDLTNDDSDEEEDTSGCKNEEGDGPIFIDLTLSDDDEEDHYRPPRIPASSDMEIESSDDEKDGAHAPRKPRPCDIDIGSSSDDYDLDEVDDLCDASADEVEQSTAQAEAIKSRQDALRHTSPRRPRTRTRDTTSKQFASKTSNNGRTLANRQVHQAAGSSRYPGSPSTRSRVVGSGARGGENPDSDHELYGTSKFVFSPSPRKARGKMKESTTRSTTTTSVAGRSSSRRSPTQLPYSNSTIVLSDTDSDAEASSILAVYD